MSTLDAPFLTEQSLPRPHPFSSTLPYPPGEEVKQADVVLLGYPVPFPLSPHVRRQNLEIYEAVTSPHGPAMTWVRRMWGVGWWSSQHLGIVPLASVSPPPAVGLMPACPLTPEHVCGGLDGAEGPRAGMGPPGEELRQRHGALQGQPGPSPDLHAHHAQPCPDRLAPLQVWTENADGSGAVNFLTGMGGFLQAVLFGVTGFR